MSEESMPTIEMSPKEVYFETVKKRVDELHEKGGLTERYTRRVLEDASLVEGPFTDAKDAENKGYLFLMAAEGMAEYCRQLNKSEMDWLAYEGDIDLILESIEKRWNFNEEQKEAYVRDFENMKVQVNQFLENIQATRDGLG